MVYQIDPSRVEKKCSDCKIILSIEKFSKNRIRSDGKNNICKKCDNVRRKTYYEKCDQNSRKNTYLKWAYGIDKKDFDNMFLRQSGRCAACGNLPNHKGLFVDHNHKTGRVRALLCLNCNSALGYLKDDFQRVQLLLEYIVKYKEEK